MADQADTRGLLAVDPEAVVQALLRAIQTAADKATMSEVVQEMDDAGKAALAFAQALVLLDPTVTQTGVPLEHDLAVEQLRGQNQIEQAKLAKAAPTPAKRLKVNRDSNGRAASYDMEGA